jgi:hypothetical protein
VSLTAPERETVINMNDADDYALISTWQRSVITKLSKNPAAERVEDMICGASRGATFRLPAELVSFRTTRRELSLEQRMAARQNLGIGRSRSFSPAIAGESQTAA